MWSLSPGSRIPCFAVRPPLRRLPAPSRGSPARERRVGARGAWGAPRRARWRSLAPLRGSSTSRRAAGQGLPPGGAEPAAPGAAPRPPPRFLSRRRGRSRPLVLTRLLFPSRGDRSRLPSAAPDSPEARRP